jgi:hypothetical protein
MQGRFSHRATAATSGPPELKIQTETPAVSHEETTPLRPTPDWLHEIKYADRHKGHGAPPHRCASRGRARSHWLTSGVMIRADPV